MGTGTRPIPRVPNPFEQRTYAKLEVESHLSVELLDLAVFFGFDDIPLELVLNLAREPRDSTGVFLHSFIESVTDRHDYDEILGPLPNSLVADEGSLIAAIGKLLSYSLARRKTNSKSLSMHPLVHTWLQDRGKSHHDPSPKARIAIAAVHRALFNATDLSQFADVQVLYSHAFTCNSHFFHMPQLFELIDAPKLAACIIAVDAWVPLSVDQGTLEKSDRFYELVAKNEDQGFTIPQSLLTLRMAYRLSSLGMRTESSKLCEEYFANTTKEMTENRYEAMYHACMAQMYGPSLFRRLMYDRAEAIFESSQTWCDPTGYMLARKQLVLAGLKCDRGRLDEAEALYLSCRDILQRRVGPGFFIWNVWHQMTALCYLDQGRYTDAEKLLQPIIDDRMSRLKAQTLLFSFSDYELIEVYSRALRKLQRFEDAIELFDDLLRHTQSKVAPPARALGELSAILAQLDTILSRAASQKSLSSLSWKGMEHHAIASLFKSAATAYERAVQAYEVEWTRGTWVFKFYDKIITELQGRPPLQATALVYSSPPACTSTSKSSTSVSDMSVEPAPSLTFSKTPGSTYTSSSRVGTSSYSSNTIKDEGALTTQFSGSIQEEEPVGPARKDKGGLSRIT